MRADSSTLEHLTYVFRWFDGFNWEGLRQRKLQAPIIPKVCGIVRAPLPDGSVFVRLNPVFRSEVDPRTEKCGIFSADGRRDVELTLVDSLRSHSSLQTEEDVRVTGWLGLQTPHGEFSATSLLSLNHRVSLIESDLTLSPRIIPCWVEIISLTSVEGFNFCQFIT